MKTTQLANVLIKILGLYFFLAGLSGLVYILPTLLTGLGTGITGGGWGAALIPVILESGLQLAFGIAVIRMSHKLTKLLFRYDNE